MPKKPGRPDYGDAMPEDLALNGEQHHETEKGNLQQAIHVGG